MAASAKAVDAALCIEGWLRGRPTHQVADIRLGAILEQVFGSLRGATDTRAMQWRKAIAVAPVYRGARTEQLAETRKIGGC